MTEKIKGIVLEVRKHNEKNDVVTVFTPSHGRITFISAVSSSKGGKLRRARLQPLSVIETEIRFNPTKEFHRLGTFNLCEIRTDIYTNPDKRLIIIFIAEFLTRMLRATMPEADLWNFINDSICCLDNQSSGYNDFHIVFLCRLLSFAGIMPDTSRYQKDMVFNMREGKFQYFTPDHNDYLKQSEARFASIIPRLNYRNIKGLHLKRKDRYLVLSKLLRYYAIHFPGTDNIRSLQMMHDFYS